MVFNMKQHAFQIFLNFARDQTDGRDIDVSDTTSSIESSVGRSSGSATAVTNPYYAHIDKTMGLGDSGKARESKPAYILPISDKYESNTEEDSYSTRL